MKGPTRYPQYLYLSGPMTRKVGLNYDLFLEVEKAIASQFEGVLNPARNFEGRTDLSRSTYIRKDIELLLKATDICFLPGWEDSKGCLLERNIAGELGLPFWYAIPSITGGFIFSRLPPPGGRLVAGIEAAAFRDKTAADSASVLHRAYELVHKDRGEAYGHPITDFTRTGKIWSAILGAPVSAEQVALCMIGLKMSRECHRPNDDNRVDIAGYVETLDMVARKREENGEQ